MEKNVKQKKKLKMHLADFPCLFFVLVLLHCGGLCETSKETRGTHSKGRECNYVRIGSMAYATDVCFAQNPADSDEKQSFMYSCDIQKYLQPKRVRWRNSLHCSGRELHTDLHKHLADISTTNGVDESGNEYALSECRNRRDAKNKLSKCWAKLRRYYFHASDSKSHTEYYSASHFVANAKNASNSQTHFRSDSKEFQFESTRNCSRQLLDTRLFEETAIALGICAQYAGVSQIVDCDTVNGTEMLTINTWFHDEMDGDNFESDSESQCTGKPSTVSFVKDGCHKYGYFSELIINQTLIGAINGSNQTDLHWHQTTYETYHSAFARYSVKCGAASIFSKSVRFIVGFVTLFFLLDFSFWIFEYIF